MPLGLVSNPVGDYTLNPDVKPDNTSGPCAGGFPLNPYIDPGNTPGPCAGGYTHADVLSYTNPLSDTMPYTYDTMLA